MVCVGGGQQRPRRDRTAGVGGVLSAGAELHVCRWRGGRASERCQVKPRHLDPRGSGTVLPDAALRDLE